MTNAALDAEFDPVWYLAQFPDVTQSGMDPREHFLRIGRRLGRLGAPDRSAQSPAGSPAAALPVAAPQAAPQPAAPSSEPASDAAQAMIRRLAADLPPPGPAPVAVRSIVPGSPVTFPIIAAPAGLTQIVADRNALLRRVPGPDSAVLRSGTVDVAQFSDTAAFSQGTPLLRLLAHLHGADPAALFALDSGMSAPPMRLDPAPAPAALAATALLGPLLLQGAARITDIWHTTSAGLCLSLGSGSDSAPASAPDETAGASDGLTLRMFQMEPGGTPRLRLVGQQRLARQAPGFAEAALCNPLCPLLIEVSDVRGLTLELGLIPFPSLARGGMHYAELLAVADGGTLLATLLGYGAGRLAEFLAEAADGSQGIGAVRIASGRATGAEPVFSQAVADWLALFGIAASTLEEAAGSPAVPATAVPVRRRAAGLTLDLPPEAMPTIAALTLRDLPVPAPGTVRVVPHLIADTATFRPRWAVTLPATPPGLAALQPTTALGGFPCLRATSSQTAFSQTGPSTAVGSDASGREALAICYRTPLREEDARHLMPLSPDSATAVLPGVPAAAAQAVVTCLLRVTDAALTRQFLDTLGAQQGTARTQVILIPAGRAQAGVLTPELAARFAGTLREAAPGWSCWNAAQDDPLEEMTAAGDSLFLAEDAAVLHDPRTLDTLRALLAVPDVATAGCMLVTETLRRGTSGITAGIGGYFPSHVGLTGGPHLIFDTPDILSALPAATYPVIANPATALLVRRDVLGQVRASGALRGVAPGAPAALAFGLAVLAAGGHNLCTSAVRVGLARQPVGQDVMDPVGLRRIAPSRWEDLLAKVTLIRGLKG